MPQVVIVGAGVIGASVAWHLSDLGVRDVVVLDRAPALGGGSTPLATGGFRAQFATEVNVRLSLLSREKLRRFPDEIGVDSGYRPYGYLFLAASDETLSVLRDAQRVQHACGLTEARMIDADEARAINPAIGPDAVRDALPFVQPVVISRPTRSARGGRSAWPADATPWGLSNSAAMRCCSTPEISIVS